MGPAHKRLLKRYAPVGVAERDQEEKPRGAMRAQEAQEREAAGEGVRVELPRGGGRRPEPGATSVKTRREAIWAERGKSRMVGRKGVSPGRWALKRERPCPPGLEDVGCERMSSGGLGILGSFRHWC